jgi:hypothetical protein
VNSEPTLITSADDDAKPDAMIEFAYLPSWNDILTTFETRTLLSKWLRTAETEVCNQFAHRHSLEVEPYLWRPRITKKTRKTPRAEFRRRLKKPFFTGPLAIDVHVWRADAHIYDVHNIALKPILDGFRDARLIVDDSVNQIKEVALIYEGIDSALKLTREERANRSHEQKQRALKKLAPKRMQVRARYVFEFFRL